MVQSCCQDGKHKILKKEQVLNYGPIVRPVRQLKRLLDGYNREAETGHLSADLLDWIEKD
jgi:hypothetical protein